MGVLPLGLLLLGALGMPTLAVPAAALAQEEVVPELRGTVLLGDGAVDTATVVLHQVTPLDAGPIDSVRVDTDGSFEFVLPTLPGSGASDDRTVYFASSRRYGILYFGDPLSQATQLDSLYTIRMYERREAEAGGEPFPIAIRNLFINRTEEGWNATDLFEIRNDSSWTYVADEQGPVWSYPLPSGATNLAVGRGDLPEDAVEFRNGAVEVSAPVPPGERLFIFTYSLADLNFDLPMPGTTEVVQVLISEPAPDLRVEGLEQDRPVEMEPGVQFRRYAGEALVNADVSFAEGDGAFTVPVRELALLLALLLTGAGVWAVRHRSEEAELEPAEESREELLLEIARLDEEFEDLEAPGAEERARYRERRSTLLERLKRTS